MIQAVMHCRYGIYSLKYLYWYVLQILIIRLYCKQRQVSRCLGVTAFISMYHVIITATRQISQIRTSEYQYTQSIDAGANTLSVLMLALYAFYFQVCFLQICPVILPRL